MADQVEALLREYTSKLRAVIRTQLETDVTAAVHRAFTGAVASAGTARSASPAKGVSTRPGEAAGARPGAPKKGRRRRGEKRSAAKLEKLTDTLLAYIAANPGQRSEQISKAIRTSTSDLALPLKKLVAEKKLKSSGVARGTTYTAAK